MIEFRADPRYRGLLDPLRIAPADEAEDLGVDWLIGLLRSDIPHEWETEIRAAVKQVLAARDARPRRLLRARARRPRGRQRRRPQGRPRPRRLQPTPASRSSGSPPPTRRRCPTPARRSRCSGSPASRCPEAGTPRDAMGAKERTSQALMTLVATYALQLMAADPAVHTVLGFDEAWVLTDTSAGRRLLRRANRLGRAQNGTPILGTQNLSDVDDELKELIGAVLAFGAETEAEARKTLAMLDVDPDDTAMRGRLHGFRQGRCLLRDYQRRLGSIQVDFDHAPELLRRCAPTPAAPAPSASRPTPPRPASPTR